MEMSVVTMETNKVQFCIDSCAKCTQACYECFNACLNEPDLNARKKCVGMLVECAMMCQMSVAMMSMNGQYSREHCQLCATICDKCAQECAMFKDDHCQKCADVCRACANDCRKMASM
jgi:hypothetical protein